MRYSPRVMLIAAACASTALAVASPSIASADDAPPRQVQVVMVTFTDSAFADAQKTQSELKQSYFGKSGSLSSYYNEVTRRTDVIAPGPAGQDGVLGPIELPMAAGCDTQQIYRETLKALEKDGLGWDDFAHLSIVFPHEKAGCGFGGLGSVSGGITWIPSDGRVDQSVLVHEFGHNFGYPHHAKTNCSDSDVASCKDSEDISHKTPMGGGTAAAGLTAPELLSSKWLSGDEVVKVGKSGTYTLRSLYGPGTGVRALDIPIGDDRLVVELRNEVGTLDKNIQGVHAYRAPKGDYWNARLVDITPKYTDKANTDALAAGTTLTDKAHKVEVKVVESADGQATVAVSLNGVPAPAAASGKKAQSGDSLAVEASAGADTKGNDLAATGTDPSTTLPLVAGGSALLAVGGGFMLRARRRRTSTARHAR
ncbi:LPXTG cell wall anchor domain-containing protein [Streptomyces coerulescens]|uniref:LPXTG cell wall anchor domain-containing protein n=1 Tax=Streptomyces coerulescens TaxID=29304 RepID=A0ABW0CU84_STRCD|nr:LPXTG cell wall anchor domain-containing protein [Streptomyces moderatus]